MICIRCGKRSKFDPSTGAKRCGHCEAPVAFAPAAGDPLSDKLFARALSRASAEGKLRFCRRHVRFELRRTLGAVSKAKFDELWARWVEIHGEPEGVVRPWPRREGPPPSEPDIGDYSFERVIIAQHAWVVDFLLWNNFHFETNAAILSIDGYPEDRFALILGMLRKNPELLVIALHDASVEGCAMSQRLVREARWFPDRGYVIDIGLGPSHRELYGGLWDVRETPAPLEQAAARVRDPEDAGAAAWLAAHSIDFGVVRPEKVMRRLFRATRQFSEPGQLPGGPRMGEVYYDDELLGAGKRKRLAYGEVTR